MNTILSALKTNVKIHVTKNIKYLTSLLGTFLLILHVLACGFIRVGHYHDGYSEGWVLLYKRNGDPTNQLWQIYVTAIYFMTTTATTVGYGDIFATTYQERIFVFACEFIGICIYSIVYNGITRQVLYMPSM